MIDEAIQFFELFYSYMVHSQQIYHTILTGPIQVKCKFAVEGCVL